MTTATLVKKASRLDLRMTDEQKRQIEAAAAASGSSVSQWSLDRLLRSARREIAEQESTVLSAQAFDEFCRLLDGPADPVFARFAARKTIWEA